jgi:hypothetical protein
MDDENIYWDLWLPNRKEVYTEFVWKSGTIQSYTKHWKDRANNSVSVIQYAQMVSIKFGISITWVSRKHQFNYISLSLFIYLFVLLLQCSFNAHLK